MEKTVLDILAAERKAWADSEEGKAAQRRFFQEVAQGAKLLINDRVRDCGPDVMQTAPRFLHGMTQQQARYAMVRLAQHGMIEIVYTGKITAKEEGVKRTTASYYDTIRITPKGWERYDSWIKGAKKGGERNE